MTVCANLSNIYNSFIVRHGRPGPNVNNYFDVEKWLAKFGQLGGDESQKQGFEKDLKRNNTVANINEDKSPGLTKPEPLRDIRDAATHPQKQILLPKTLSTQHIPMQARSKQSKRVYANFDKENAARMFGFRVTFTKSKMDFKVPEPKASQAHKPLTRFVSDIVNDLSNTYIPV